MKGPSTILKYPLFQTNTQESQWEWAPAPGEPRTQRHTTEWEQAEEIKEETTKSPLR